MIYCTICLQPDTRPNTFFSEKGICPACEYHKKLQHVDWEERFSILEALLKTAPRRDHQYYDCIIGVSGGKDSQRQALWLRDKFGLKPLLACLSYPPEQVTDRGTKNLSNLIEQGFDVVVSAPAPGVWRDLMRESFMRFTNWCKSTELALFASVPQLAIKYDIPLLLWGENPGLQLGDLKTLGSTGYDGNNLRNMNTLSGGKLDWHLDVVPNPANMIPYQYPSIDAFKLHNIQIVYLGWFLRDWSLVNNAKYSVTTGLDIRTDDVSKTGDLWGVTALDEDWVTLNQMIKYYKFGFGRVTDYANEAIRNGTLSREDGISLVSCYDDACDPKYIAQFCQYISISVDEFWEQVIKSVNRKLFNVDSSGKITRKFKVGIGL